MEEVKTKKKKSQRWGIMIAALYSGFALFMIILVIIASRQHFDLVDSDYYKRGLQYQSRIDQSNRAQDLTTGVTLALSATGDSVLVTFPPECALDTIGGTLHFYRPSNAGWDKTIPISTREDGTQSITREQFVAGLWRVKADWSWRGESYYNEIELFIPKKS